MPRDSRRRKLYDAEWTIRADSPRLPDVAAVEAFIEKVMTSAFVQTRWGRVRVNYEQTRGGSGNYNSWSNRIRTGKNTTEHVILHEIAHALTPNRYASHGPEFAAVLLTLVGRFSGTDAARQLRTAYVKHGVRYRPGMKAVPVAGSHLVVTKGERLASVAASRRASIQRPVTPRDRKDAAATLRRMIAQGEFGPSGRKPRLHALEVARKLENGG